MNHNEKENKIPKCNSCYPRLSNRLSQQQNNKMPFEAGKILNVLYSILIGIITGVATRNYIKYHKIIGVVFGILFFILNKKLLKSDD